MKHLPRIRRSFALPALAVLGAVSTISQSQALTWTGPGGTVETPTNGVWDTATPNLWAFAESGPGDTAWIESVDAVFGGASGVGITVAENIVANTLTFNTTGYSLTAASAVSVTMNAADRLTIASGVTTTIGSNVTLTRSGDFLAVNTGGVAGGTLNIDSGGTLSLTGQRQLSLMGVGTVINVNNGGQLLRTNLTANAFNQNMSIGVNVADDVTVNVETGGVVQVGGRYTIISQNGATGTLNVNGGSFTQLDAGSNSHLFVGFHNGSNATLNVTNGGSVTLQRAAGEVVIGTGGASTIARVNVDGGTLTVGGRITIGDLSADTVMTVSGTGTVTAGGVGLTIGQASGSNGTFNLDGGSVTVAGVAGGAGTSTVNFNGGTLRASTAAATFVTGLTSANVGNGGAVVDSNGFDIGIGQALVANGAGGLTKLGVGTLTLTGANTYVGDTVVEGGTLSINTAYLADGANIFLADGAIFDLNFAGTDTVNGLVLGGVGQAIGTWGSLTSSADNKSAFFTGDGILMVTTVIPEPGTVALLIVGGAFAFFHMRPRRKA